MTSKETIRSTTTVVMVKRSLASDVCIPCPLEIEITASDPGHGNMALIGETVAPSTVELLYEEHRWHKTFAAHKMM